MQKKTDLYLIIITVILVAILIGGFIYDRNSALLARTNYFPISEDQNLEIVKMDKAGFLYRRAGYQAKIKIIDGKADEYIIEIASTYGGEGAMFDYQQYKEYEADVLQKATLRPSPDPDTFIWVLGVPLNEKTTENIVYIVSVESDGAYIYMYYSRK